MTSLNDINMRKEKEVAREKRNEIKKQLIILHNAIKKGEPIFLDEKYFSEALLGYFYLEGVFTPSKHNHYNSESELDFMLEMFNKEYIPSLKQREKTFAILELKIIPYVRKLFRTQKICIEPQPKNTTLDDFGLTF